MLSLLNGDKKIAELTADVVARETSILHVLKEFEAADLTAKNGGTYKLTPLGIIDAQICRECITTSEVLDSLKEFWLTHDVTPIPPYLMLRIGELKGANLIKTATSDLEKVHQTFLQVLTSSRTIRGTSPIFHPDYTQIFKQLLDHDGTIELILTSSVLEKTLAAAESELFKKYIKANRLRIYLKEDLKIALTVTDNAVSLGLFRANGEYDYNMDVISINQNAIRWGNDLFQECIKVSKKLDVDTIV